MPAPFFLRREVSGPFRKLNCELGFENPAIENAYLQTTAANRGAPAVCADPIEEGKHARTGRPGEWKRFPYTHFEERKSP